MKLWKVTCEGKTLPELKKALEGALREISGGHEVVSSVKVSQEVVDEEEYVDESEISTHAPSASKGELDFSDLDSQGLPWDARIHASSKAKYSNDGTWKIKRGVSDTEADAIRSEYRKTPVAATPPVFNPPVQAPLYTPTQAPVAPIIVEAPYVAPPMPTMNSGHTVASFKANFPLVLGGLITEGKVTQEYVNVLKTHFGVAQIWDLNDAQKEEVFHSFVGYKLIQQVG